MITNHFTRDKITVGIGKSYIRGIDATLALRDKSDNSYYDCLPQAMDGK